jgi:hypothetical protein
MQTTAENKLVKDNPNAARTDFSGVAYWTMQAITTNNPIAESRV